MHCPHCNAPSPWRHRLISRLDFSFRCRACGQTFYAVDKKVMRRAVLVLMVWMFVLAVCAMFTLRTFGVDALISTMLLGGAAGLAALAVASNGANTVKTIPRQQVRDEWRALFVSFAYMAIFAVLFVLKLMDVIGWAIVLSIWGPASVIYLIDAIIHRHKDQSTSGSMAEGHDDV
jgi:hypothetical protein